MVLRLLQLRLLHALLLLCLLLLLVVRLQMLMLPWALWWALLASVVFIEVG